MATVLQPWAGHRDVIRRGLTLSLDQDRHARNLVSFAKHFNINLLTPKCPFRPRQRRAPKLADGRM